MRDPSVTMDGAVYVRENSRMAKARGFLGHAFDVALGAAVSVAASLI